MQNEATAPVDITSRIQARDGVAVVLFTQELCQPCRMTKKLLDREGIFYTEVNVAADPDALAYIKGLGYTQAPVVYTSTEQGDFHWSGLNVALIRQHITHREDS